MEQLLETIDLDIEEANELLFKVKVEGIDQAPAKVRLVCETGDVDYMFQGHSTSEEGVVQFVLPNMKGKLKEGQYLSRVEVLIENRYFAPVQFNINYKQAVRVVAEAVRAPAHKPVPRVSVTASAPIVVNRKSALPPPPPAQVAEAAKPAIIQEPPVKPVARPAPVPPVVAKKQQFAPRIPTTTPAPKPQSLKERYARKQVEELSDSSGEDLIKELARSFVRKK